ncbi:MAG: hypothetical protein Q4E65_07010 [Clostridia bacterium]|nr:hypothetical protein [Clostridia bacterium]
MKLIKKKMIYMACVAAAGIGMLAVGLLRADSQISGVGIGMLVVSALKLIQYLRMMKDPEKVRQLEVVQKEERLIFLANKSAAITLYALILIAYAAMLVLLFMGHSLPATCIAYGVCGTLIIYCVVRWILSKKY